MKHIRMLAMARPKFKIDYDQAEKLAGLQCTQEEIASYLGCSVDTLQRDDTFCGIYKKGMNKGRMSLRRKQWAALDNGNTTMLIWLGKQYLGQKEKPEEFSNDEDKAQSLNITFSVADPVSDITVTNAKS